MSTVTGRPALVAFDSCTDLLTGLRSALKTTGNDHLPDTGAMRAAGPAAPAGAAAVADGAAASVPLAGADTGNTAYSATNTAEPGVDEPDLVKTDGARIVSIVDGVLRVVDAASRRVTGTLALTRTYEVAPAYENLLLAGDHALVAQQSGATEELLLVDLAGPAPRVASTYEIDGWFVDARQVGSTVRVVVGSAPRRVPGTPVDALGVTDLLPGYRLSTPDGTAHGRVDCRSVSRSDSYTGTSLLTVLSWDLNRPVLDAGDPVTIVADAQTVYSDGTVLYVAGSPRYRVMPQAAQHCDPCMFAPPQPHTMLYALDISGGGRPRYVAGGSVPGTLLNQYALSQWHGDLRVATTSGDASSVYVLRRQGDQLRQIGAVGGLGKGQRVYGVRFAGPVGYVVTFRQTDPLYTVDLRDPAHPVVTGALELTGYSAYLHPVGDGLLIGLGQEANTRGRVLGTQVSLFDVSNPAKPRRLAHYVLPGAWSNAEFDPHAFLYWPATGLLAVPVTVTRRSSGAPGAGSGGMLALRVAGGTITPLHWPASHPAETLRALVVNGTVWTVTTRGLAANDLATLAPVSWLPF